MTETIVESNPRDNLSSSAAAATTRQQTTAAAAAAAHDQVESANQLLQWINETLEASYKHVEELASGAAYAQLMDCLYPGTIPLRMIKFRANQEQDYVNNFKLVQLALNKVGCDKDIPVSKLVFKKFRYQDNLEFLRWFKKYFEENYDGHEYNALEARENIPLGSGEEQKQLVVANLFRPHRPTGYLNGFSYNYVDDEEDDDDDDDDDFEARYRYSLIDHNWSKKILELVGNRANLMESFSWLSTIGGGFSCLGERDQRFSMRAATLSLGHQLKLAEQLGDERLKVMCHMFAALAALQMDNKQFCVDYIARIIMPMLKQLPYSDPILINIMRHINFRLTAMDRFRIWQAGLGYSANKGNGLK